MQSNQRKKEFRNINIKMTYLTATKQHLDV